MKENIGNVKDVHYRYKMEQMELKVEGRGNGIKTLVTNLADVAADLKIPPQYIIKYFGLELGSQNTYDKETGRGVVNGQHTYADLKKILDAFVAKFILCPKCKLPELAMTVEGDDVKIDCKACGYIGKINPQEKLCRHIVKDPPPKRVAKKAAPTPSNETAEETTTKKSSKKSKAQPAEDDDVEWSVDTSEAAVKQRREEEALSSRIKTMTMGEDEEQEDENGEEGEEEEISPIDLLKRFLEAKPNPTEIEFAKAVKKIREDYSLEEDDDVVCLVFEGMFTHQDDVLSDKKVKLLKRYVKTPEQQMTVLGYIEDFVGKQYTDLIVKTPLILEKFYDNEVLEESVLQEWHEKKKSKFVKSSTTLKKIKEAAKPFIQWLQTAEEDGDE